jgi:hypothetical protein
MKKDAFYFPHFSNARHDRKIRRVTKELGIEGYGIYFMLLEVLRDQPELSYPIMDIDLLADEFNTSEAKIRTVVCNYGLFEVDEKEMFFSVKFEQYLEPYFKMKNQRIAAGKASGEKRRQLALQQKNERPFNDRSATDEQSKVKESKQSKERKEKGFDFKNSLLDLDAKEQLVIDWLKVRKTKKATNSETALKTFLKEVEKSGIKLNDVLELCIKKDWKGFEADWIKEKTNTVSNEAELAMAESRKYKQSH